MQRGNLDMALLPPSDFAQQVPAFDILGAAYVVRDAAHLERVFKSDVGQSFVKLAREKLNVVILAPAYYGTRQLNLKGSKKVRVPEDLAGVKLRMPGGESWQLLGRSIGANPVPLAYAETYVGLQTGVVDGQDNPLPNTRLMKFHEVTNQIVLTGHNVGFGLLIVRAPLFDALTPAQQQRLSDAAFKAFAWSTAEYLKQEQELVAFFKCGQPGRVHARRDGVPHVCAEAVPAVAAVEVVAAGHAGQDQRAVGRNERWSGAATCGHEADCVAGPTRPHRRGPHR